MPIEPVKIPQNVYIEDRIVGPLTLRQTLIMALGGGFSYAIFGALQKANGSVSIPVTILAWTPCAIAVAFALVKINDLSLMRICLLMLERLQKPSVRAFAPRKGISINIRMGVPKEEKPAAPKADATLGTEKKIQELSRVLDTGFREAPASEEPSAEPEATVEKAEQESEERSTLPPRPVDPRRISVDDNHPTELGGAGLQVFRDIFPNP